ncbi:hypothetical protein BRAO375_3700029 [Bradyrhizobium sp. ORS 375]|nr:hypothetical protein BRAO375_3700029 [Bradyrhizobium sp. ORS 375]
MLPATLFADPSGGCQTIVTPPLSTLRIVALPLPCKRRDATEILGDLAHATSIIIQGNVSRATHTVRHALSARIRRCAAEPRA